MPGHLRAGKTFFNGQPNEERIAVLSGREGLRGSPREGSGGEKCGLEPHRREIHHIPTVAGSDTLGGNTSFLSRGWCRFRAAFSVGWHRS